MKILYVEDDPNHADLTGRALHKSAPQVQLETASTLREAYARLARLASDPLDLVLTDMHLPDGNGLSLLRHIRESSLELAVVLITGMGDEETAVAALKASADDYVVKHKDYLQRLPVILESALNHYRADAARRAHPLNILYAEDELGAVESTRRHFAVHSNHLHLDAVFTGPEVLTALKTQDGALRYDVLLMNFDLYGLKALEVLKELRLTRRLDIPIVLLCRAGDEDLARQGLKLGASSYLVKNPGYLHQLPWELEEAHSRAELLRRDVALQASEEKYRTLFDSIDEGFCVFEVIFDGEGRPVDLLFSVTNPAFGRQTGWGDVVGQPVKELLPDLEATWLEKYGQIATTGEPQRFTERAAGLNRWYEVYAFRVGDAGNRTVAVIFSDVSERIRAAEVINRSEAVLAQAGQMANLGAWEVDISHSDDLNEWAVVWSEQVYRIFGYEPGSVEVTGELFFRHVHPADRRRLEDAVSTAVAKREPYSTEYRIKRADGVERVVHGNAVVEVDGAGLPRRIIGALQDVTERKVAEEALRESEKHFRATFEQAAVGVAHVSLDGRLLLMNQKLCDIVGYTPEELRDRTYEEFTHPEDLEVDLDYARRFQAGEIESCSFEKRYLRKDGSVVWVHLTASLVREDADGKPSYLIVILKDISARKGAEEALRTSEEFNRRIVDSSSDCIKILDPEGRLLYISPRGQELLGIEDPEAYLNGSWIELWPGEGRLAALAAIEQAKVSDAGAFQAFGPTPQGQPKWWDTVITPMTDERGQIVRLLAVSRDITESKLAHAAVTERNQLLHGVFSSLSAHVVVLDCNGFITYASKSWTQFATENQGRTERVSVGVNYLEVCRRASTDGEVDARHALQGICAVMSREHPTFTIEYPCDAPRKQRWFLMQVDPMPIEHGGVVISHIDITERKLAAEALKSALAEVRQLKDRLQEENIYLQEEVQGASNFGEIIGRSEMLKRVLNQVAKVAPTGTTALILGETGTGKELLARAIHDLSPQRGHPMVKVNCAALPGSLIESELFGHEKGAFTGATAQRRGRFELADGGTIFLDEVGELPIDLQAKLLRVLEKGEFERVGGSRTLQVDVRVIAATNRRLEEAVQEGTFRSDLYYRLNVYPITLPPLRKRPEDIPILVRHFVKELSLTMGKQIETIPHDAMNALQNYSWPGNIRELRNVIERAVIITRGTTLRLTDDLGLDEGAHRIGQSTESSQDGYGATETLVQSEYNLILRTLKRINWKVEGPGGAAELLDIHPSTLRTRMKKLGISRS